MGAVDAGGGVGLMGIQIKRPTWGMTIFGA